MKKNYILVLILLIGIFLTGCKNKQEPEYLRKKFVLDSTFGSLVPEVWVIATQEKFDEYKDLRVRMSEITNELDAIYNPSRTDSLLSKVNDMAGGEPVEVSAEFITVLKEAIRVSELTLVDTEDGKIALYDISILPVVNEWNINELQYYKTWDSQPIPEKEKIEALLPLVNYTNIVIDEEASTVCLKEKGMMIDLGSILKGYAADKIRNYLQSIGITRGVVNVAGNLVMMGHDYVDYKDVEWTVKIATPDSSAADTYYVGYIKSTDITAVTSGTYERFILTDDDETYHHILDPRTGYPNNSGLVSVTIFTDNSMNADAMSTATFSLGLDAGIKLIDSIEETEAVFITDVTDENGKKEIYITKGLQGRFVYNNKLDDLGYSYKGVKDGTSN